MAEMNAGYKPLISIETKGEKKMMSMVKYIDEDFVKNKNAKIARNVASKLKTRLQLSFLGSNVRTEVSQGGDFKASVTNISELNRVLNDKAFKETGKYIDQLYQEEFEKVKEVK